MNFTLANADLDCGLTNEAVVAALVMTALLFGAWLAWVVLSRKPRGQKVMLGGAALLLSYVGYVLARGTALSVQTWEHRGAGTQFGCMNSSSLHHAPVAAALCALVFSLTVAIFQRARLERAP